MKPTMDNRIETKIDIHGIPVFNVSLAGSDDKYLAMVDTGAEITVFSDTVAEDLNLKVENSKNYAVTFVHAEGKASKPTEAAAVDAHIQCTDGAIRSIRFEGITTDLSIINKYYNQQFNNNDTFMLIVGTDTLNRMDAQIDYEKGVIRFNDISGK